MIEKYEVIDSAFKKIADSRRKDLEIHFVCAGCRYYGLTEDRLRALLLKGMKKGKIPKVMVTIIEMKRWSVITKERVKSFCLGKRFETQSVNDDLDTLFEDLRLSKLSITKLLSPVKYYTIQTYYLPMLTEKELEMAGRRNPNYLRSFAAMNPYGTVPSESDSRFVEAYNIRRTFLVKTPFPQNIASCYKIIYCQ